MKTQSGYNDFGFSKSKLDDIIQLVFYHLVCQKNCWNFFNHQVNKFLRITKENWIEGGGDRVSVHFAVTFLDCWRTSFCVTTITKIVNNNTNDKQTSGISGALDEDSPYTNLSLFTLDRLPLLLLLRKN